ncbi:MAG: azurin [Chitinophagales bacterium]|nr:azurin [Chitinophagales bacterium]MCZ2392303.1 azurin [Chitinophagales bacterium]
MASSALLFVACNNSSETSTAPAPEETAEVVDPATLAPLEVTINADDNMKYDVTEITAKEGQKVKVILHHVGKLPIASMGHNFVLLTEGSDLAQFAIEAINAKDNDYIPASLVDEVIAHTKTIGGGETAEVEFTAPAKGTYEFLCSFPGHSAMMKGTFIVE